MNLENFDPQMFGTCKKVTISKDDTVMEREIRRQLKRELSRFFVSLVSIDSLESYVLIALI